MKFFEIDFLEAGENSSGDAIALRYRDDDDNDYIHVIDGGYSDDGDKLIQHIEKYYDNATFIDHVILTHPDADHALGLRKVLEHFQVGQLWMNRPWQHIDQLIPRFDYKYTETGLTRRLKEDFKNTTTLEKIAVEKEIPISDVFQGDEIGPFTVLAPSLDRYVDLIVASEKTPEEQRKAEMSGAIYDKVVPLAEYIKSLWGDESLKGDTDGTSSENEMSVVQFAILCDNQILLTADAGVEALEEAYAASGFIGAVPALDYFQVPHHGSRRNVSSDVLDKWLGGKLDNQTSDGSCCAIISANRNDKEHPRKAVVRAMYHRGAKVVQGKGTLHAYKNAPDRGWTAATPLDYPEDMED